MENNKVSVIARFYSDGHIVPQAIIWEDGRRFNIDAVEDIQRRASFKIGQSGIRYTCRIKGRMFYLILDDIYWYLDAV